MWENNMLIMLDELQVGAQRGCEEHVGSLRAL
jgi:hypothetical protein